MFSREILVKNRIPSQSYQRKDILFREEEKAGHLYYLLDGEVRIHNTDSEGKEFLIEKVTSHNFLGEPPFLLEERYPATAIINSDTAEIFRFSREQFKTFMVDHPEILLEFTCNIAQKAFNKTHKIKSIVHQSPQERILNFMKNHKRTLGICPDEKIMIDVTRKEIANSTGLVVETVIRAVKKMEREGKIELINHKIYF